ncbi:MAG: methyltransferase domain-containing protein [Deltaproteobacteria bacterium]|nr:methyltransferase domain-containing protein [Deltaproteobacteria bacterium]
MITKRLLRRFYPDDTRDGTRQFYSWVRQGLRADSCVLNLGAGPATKQPMRIIQGEVATVIGADVDPIVFHNDEIDEAVLIVDGRLPLEANRFDVIVSDNVLEHVGEPERFLAEAYRVLKPNGSLFFRTPNKHHYVAAIARYTPHWFHELVANPARGMANDAHDPWETFYRLNRPSEIDRIASPLGFAALETHMSEAEPAYLMFSTLPFLIGVAYERLVNRFDALATFRACILGRLRKPA